VGFWQLEHPFWKIQKSAQLETRIGVQVARMGVQVGPEYAISF